MKKFDSRQKFDCMWHQIQHCGTVLSIESFDFCPSSELRQLEHPRIEKL